MSISPISAGDPYTADIMNRLNSAGQNPGAQTKVVAQQFEAILLRQFLDKSVGSMMGDGAGSDVYGYMLTSALSQKLAEGGGLGLASVFQRQLAPAGVPAAGTAAAPAAGTAAGAGTGTTTGGLQTPSTAAAMAPLAAVLAPLTQPTP